MNYIHPQYRYIHKDIQDIPEIYRTKSLHIALEFSDVNKDWVTFRKLYTLYPTFLKEHLDMTSFIFDYNYKRLPKNELDNLFAIN
jgi:hypothetical protein